MNISNLSLPYPVLGLEGDFKEGSFSIQPNVYSFEELLVIDDIGGTLEISNNYIADLYNQELALLAIKVNCSSTLYSKTFLGDRKIEINLTDIAKSIEIEIYLIASRDIDNYYDESFNEDYSLSDNEGIFQVKKGQIIGVLKSVSIPLGEEFLNGAIGIFKFSRIDQNPIDFNHDSKKIEINYPFKEGQSDIIQVLSRTAKMTFVNLFIIPALNYAFSLISKETEEGNIDEFLKENDWAYIIVNEFPDYINNIDKPYSNAQLFVNKMFSNTEGVIDLPIFSTLKELN